MLLPITTDHAETKRAPLANVAIVIVTCLVSLALLHRLDDAVLSVYIDRKGALLEVGSLRHLMLVRGGGLDPLQLVGHTLLHGGGWHLLGNMVLLLCFGNPVNARLGHARYLGLYAVSAAAGGVGWLIFGDGAVAIGASGAVCGVMAAFLVLFPFTRVHVLFWFLGLVLVGGAGVWHLAGLDPSMGLLYVFGALVIGTIALSMLSLAEQAPPEGALLHVLGFRSFPVAGVWVVAWFLGWDVVAVFTRISDQVAHSAHLGGAAAGLAIGFGLALAGFVRGTREDPTLPEVVRLVPPAPAPPIAPAPTPRGSSALPPTRRFGAPALSFDDFARQRRVSA